MPPTRRWFDTDRIAWAGLYAMTTISLISLAYILFRLTTHTLQPRRLLWNQMWMLSTWAMLNVATCWPLIAQAKDENSLVRVAQQRLKYGPSSARNLNESARKMHRVRALIFIGATIGHMLT